MKKIIFLTLLLSVALLFVSCQGDGDIQTEATTAAQETSVETAATSKETSNEETAMKTVATSEATSAEKTIAETIATTEIIETEEDEKTTEYISESSTAAGSVDDQYCPPNIGVYNFDSYEHMVAQLQDPNSEINQQKSKCGEMFITLTDAIAENPDLLRYPCNNGNIANTSDESITYFAIDHYNMPWLYTRYNDIVVMLTYPEIILDFEVDKSLSNDEIVLDIVKRTGLTEERFSKYHEWLPTEDIQLYNQYIDNALVYITTYGYTQPYPVDYVFYTNGVLVNIRSAPDVLTPNFFAELSFE